MDRRESYWMDIFPVLLMSSRISNWNPKRLWWRCISNRKSKLSTAGRSHFRTIHPVYGWRLKHESEGRFICRTTMFGHEWTEVGSENCYDRIAIACLGRYSPKSLGSVMTNLKGSKAVVVDLIKRYQAHNWTAERTTGRIKADSFVAEALLRTHCVCLLVILFTHPVAHGLLHEPSASIFTRSYLYDPTPPGMWKWKMLVHSVSHIILTKREPQHHRRKSRRKPWWLRTILSFVSARMVATGTRYPMCTSRLDKKYVGKCS
jgi:hypothetical protein